VKRHIRRTRVNNVKEFIWRRQLLNNKLTVVCDVKIPHMIDIHEILLIGVGTPLPYAFCPQHQAYFGVSADIDMKNKTIILRGNRGKQHGSRS
jgi:hypothetical protein